MNFPLSLAGLSLFLLSGTLWATEVPVPLLNASFEEVEEGLLPQPKQWQAAIGYPNTYDVTEHDALGAADGKMALLCAVSDYAAVSQLTSTPLIPGASYKLSAKFLPRVSKEAQSGGFWLRMLVRNTANPADAHIVANVAGGAETLSPGEWTAKNISWTAPAALDAVPIISSGITGMKPDASKDLSSGSYVLEVLVGSSFPLRNPEETTLFQTWIDSVTFTQSTPQ